MTPESKKITEALSYLLERVKSLPTDAPENKKIAEALSYSTAQKQLAEEKWTKVHDLPGCCTVAAVQRAWELLRNDFPCRILSYKITEGPFRGICHSVLVFWSQDGHAHIYDVNSGTRDVGKMGQEVNPNFFALKEEPSARQAAWQTGLMVPKVDPTKSLKTLAEKLKTMSRQHAEKLKAESDKFFSGLAAALSVPDEDGHWVTTKYNHKLYINDKGEVLVGNPHVVAHIKEHHPEGKAVVTKKGDLYAHGGGKPNVPKGSENEYIEVKDHQSETHQPEPEPAQSHESDQQFRESYEEDPDSSARRLSPRTDGLSHEEADRQLQDVEEQLKGKGFDDVKEARRNAQYGEPNDPNPKLRLTEEGAKYKLLEQRKETLQKGSEYGKAKHFIEAGRIEEDPSTWTELPSSDQARAIELQDHIDNFDPEDFDEEDRQGEVTRHESDKAEFATLRKKAISAYRDEKKKAIRTISKYDKMAEDRYNAALRNLGEHPDDDSDEGDET
jgi:hypothetical protein